MACRAERLRPKVEVENGNSAVNLNLKPQPNSLDKAVRAQGGAVVKPHQVKAMILAARRAYVKVVVGSRSRTEEVKNSTVGLGLPTTTISFDVWRRATLHDVVGAAAPSSFRAVTQRDYVAVMRYFGELAGEDSRLRLEVEVDSRISQPQPLTSTSRSADERRRALWALNLEEGRLEDAFGGREGARRYADSLFWKIHRTDRLTANARQVWAVIFTLRSRAAKRRLRPEVEVEGERLRLKVEVEKNRLSTSTSNLNLRPKP